jgi:hypothetical protein
MMTGEVPGPELPPDLGGRVAGVAGAVGSPTEHVEALERAGGAYLDPAEGQEPRRYFPSLVEFVSLWLLPTFRRPLAALGMGSWHWCPRWWAHPEARLVFGALWDQWEANRSEPLGMVEFTRDVLQLLPQVCGAHGPFARCRAAPGDGRGGLRHRQVPVAPAEPAPPGWWEGWWDTDGDDSDGQEDGQGGPPLLFGGVEEFVVGLMLPTFRRDPGAVGMMRWSWCEQWWRHDEVVHCYLSLWYLFEARARQRRLVEFVREVYFLLPHLHAEDGSMRQCVASGRPGGPRHVDVPIAPVQHRPEVAGRGASEGDWVAELVAWRPPVGEPV